MADSFLHVSGSNSPHDLATHHKLLGRGCDAGRPTCRSGHRFDEALRRRRLDPRLGHAAAPRTARRQAREAKAAWRYRPVSSGSLVFGDKGRAALGPFLLQFGQLLKLEVDGAPYWLFNVTQLVACIDRARSEQRAGGTIGKEAFVESALPIVPAVFKDPITARARIYVDDGGKLARGGGRAVRNPWTQVSARRSGRTGAVKRRMSLMEDERPATRSLIRSARPAASMREAVEKAARGWVRTGSIKARGNREPVAP